MVQGARTPTGKLEPSSPFPARSRLRAVLPGEPVGPILHEDLLLQAVRRLRGQEAGAGEEEAQPPAEARLEQERRLAALELERQNARLRKLLGLEEPHGRGRSDPPAAAPGELQPRLPECRELLDRARAFHEEWRQLMLDDPSPELVLREFAASPYLDLLEKRHDLLWLLLDREGCLLRAGHGERAPAPLEAGLWLEPGPLSGGQVALRRSPWLKCGSWLGLELEGGLFLVSPTC